MNFLNKKILLFTAILFSIFVFTNILPLSAADLTDAFNKADLAAGAAGYTTDESTDINTIIAIIIRTGLSILGILFLALLVYGGYLWMTDRGNEEQVKRARGLISSAIIGLIIVLSAYAVSVFVLDNLASQTLIESQGDESPNAQ